MIQTLIESDAYPAGPGDVDLQPVEAAADQVARGLDRFADVFSLSVEVIEEVTMTAEPSFDRWVMTNLLLTPSTFVQFADVGLDPGLVGRVEAPSRR